MFGGNIKVHFAGTEDENDAVATTVGGVNYSLFTAYPFVAKKTKLKKKPVSLRIIEEHHKHTIMDSGLFTLMFGAQAGKKDAAFIERWFESLCEFVEEIGVKATCVEVDCQKVLGVDAAWSFRKRMKDRLKNRQINVFHLEDGKAGFDRLIEFSDYIAISVPELRIAHRKTFREDVLRFASYAKNKKPEIDIHLLGCTDPDLLRSCRFCTSSDSTSWCTPRFSWHYLGRNGRSFKSERTERFGEEAERLLAEYGRTISPRRKWTLSQFTESAFVHKREYERVAGSQQ